MDSTISQIVGNEYGVLKKDWVVCLHPVWGRGYQQKKRWW